MASKAMAFSRRRTRFLVGALPTFLLTIKPNRVVDPVPGNTLTTVNFSA